MIEVAVANGALVFIGELGVGEEAYVDADWLTGTAAGPVPTLVATADSVVSSWDGQAFALPDEVSAEGIIADAFIRVAAAAAAAAVSSGRPAVAGSGFVAATVRSLLDPDDTHEEPDLIVESRGDPRSLLESTRRVADLGTVVLAGMPAVDPFPFDLYPDVHVRGLRLFALRFVLDPAPAAAPESLSPTDVRLGEPIGEGQWYRVSSG